MPQGVYGEYSPQLVSVGGHLRRVGPGCDTLGRFDDLLAQRRLERELKDFYYDFYDDDLDDEDLAK